METTPTTTTKTNTVPEVQFPAVEKRREHRNINPYLVQLFTLRCAGDLLDMSIFPNAKEWTESCGVYEHIPLGIDRKNPDVLCLAVGDGKQPRTGAMVAMRTAWTVMSVDPRLSHDGQHPRICRLSLHRTTLERLEIPKQPWDAIVMLHTHSHDQWPRSLKPVFKQMMVPPFIVTMDCCVAHALTDTTGYVSNDPHCLSPRNTVHVWTCGQTERSKEWKTRHS